jgi:hypothetical protein
MVGEADWVALGTMLELFSSLVLQAQREEVFSNHLRVTQSRNSCQRGTLAPSHFRFPGSLCPFLLLIVAAHGRIRHQARILSATKYCREFASRAAPQDSKVLVDGHLGVNESDLLLLVSCAIFVP